ncbi:MAG TPA: carbonate dehydratase [Porticoccaceae bacterium]|nr:carbonate dehydratase [Porticoccaceae bacterium]
MQETPLKELFDNNRAWVRAITDKTPDFFTKLSNQQSPEYLWIGCSDSRVPANEILGMLPGELFVHRNVANVVVHTDLNCLSVLQFAVDYLKVKHVMVVGHYGCGGVKAAVCNHKLGLIDNWLRHVQDAQNKHYKELGAITDEDALVDRVCELNVVEQALSVCQTTVIQDAWARGQNVTVHSWIYSIKDGLLRDLGMSVGDSDSIYPAYGAAVRSVFSKDHALNP